jgi:hypothetical protein
MCRRWADNVGLSPHREFDHTMSEDASNVFIVGYVSQAKLHPIPGCVESQRNFDHI